MATTPARVLDATTIMAWRALKVLLSMSLVLVACRAGVVGEAVRPVDPKGSAALDGNPTKCRSTAGPAEPLVVDWKSDARAELELAMRGGVVVVRYDCDQLAVLDRCRLDGSYAFAGVTRKEESVQIVNRDELAANVPLAKATFSAALDRGSSLDIALVMIGKQATTVGSAIRTQLQGECDGATHYLRGAYVGAFALRTGTAGKVQAVADIFGAGVKAGSASDRNTATKEGELDACRAATARAEAPPEQCGAAIRLQLEPIGDADSKPSDDKGERSPCPSGMALSEGKCSAAVASKAHLCDPKDKAECEAQCELGDSGSCYNLGVQREASDPEGALTAYERGCDRGNARACSAAGFAWMTRRMQAKDDQAKLDARLKAENRLAQACDRGDAWTCWNTSTWYLRTGALEVFPRDPSRAMALLRRGCDLGYAPSCSSLAAALMAGKDAPRDVPAALGLLVRGCDGGSAEDCTRLGDTQRQGKLVMKDPAAAVAAYRKGCDRGGAIACFNAGTMLANGEGVSKDAGAAVAVWSQACNENVAGWDACKSLGQALERGDGTAKDAERAAVAYQRGCTRGGCLRAGEIYEKGLGVTVDLTKAREAYDQGCKRFADAQACKAAKRLGAGS